MKNKNVLIVLLALAALVVGYFIWIDYHPKPLINIGVILPLTGDEAPYGKKLKAGVEFAYNNSTNKDRINLVIEDSRSNDNGVLSSYTKLTTVDNCKMLIGPFSSGSVLALSSQVEKDNVILLAPTATAPEISNAGDNIFRIISSDIYDSKVLAEYITSVKGAKKLAIVYINNDYGLGFANSFAKAIEAKGINDLERIAIENSITDFRTIIRKLKNANVEGVVIIGINEIGYFLKQAKELKLDNMYYSTGMVENPEILKIAGESANGVIYSYPTFDISSTDTIVANFVNNFKEQTNKEPSILEALGNDAYSLYDLAIGRNALKPEEIMAFFLNLENHPLVSGEASFDNNGDVVKPIGIKQIVEGKYVWIDNNFKISK